MKRTNIRILILCGFSALALVIANGVRSASTERDVRPIIGPVDPAQTAEFDRLIVLAREKGSVRVILQLATAFAPEGKLRADEMYDQRVGIKRAQEDLLARYRTGAVRQVTQFEYIPYLGAEVGAAELDRMKRDPRITGIFEDQIAEAALAESGPIVGAPTAWASGYTGSGQTVAIIDSGVDKNHTFLAGKVVSEACYSSNNASSTSVCPGAVTESTAANSGLNCSTTIDGCAHGTNVAGIAAGKGVSFSGVAKDANIIAIQVFSRFDSATNCGSTPVPCALYWTSDLIKGLERVRTLSLTMSNIAAVNLSLQTGQQFISNCDSAHAPTKAAIDNLRSVGIATVVCAGNFSFTNALTAPACISTSISVGSTDDGSLGTSQDVVSSFSDSSPLLHLLAPGRWINSSIPGNLFQNYSGTSMAAPHVVGSFALLRQRKPTATIGQITTALIATGTPITDTRNSIVKPRIRVDRALQAIIKTPFDFDGDDRADVSVFRPSAGAWYILNSSNGAFIGQQFGQNGDRIVPADFDGDGKTDFGVFRPSNGGWYWLNSGNGTLSATTFGVSSDLPVTGDVDGDGKADIGVYRPSAGGWFGLLSSTGQFVGVNFGIAEDRPAVGDFDGDGLSDVSVFRPSTGGWYRLNSSNGQFVGVTFGVNGDKPAPADYDGDGKTDICVFRPSTGSWFRLNSSNGAFVGVSFGLNGDLPSAGDFDGDGRADPVVFRPSAGAWYLLNSTSGFSGVAFGTNGDAPTPNAFVY
jgi:subtilisin family serine protease